MLNEIEILDDSEIDLLEPEQVYASNSTLIAKEMILSLKAKNIWVDSKFEDNKWKLRTNIKKNVFQYIEFSDYHSENISSVKCWIINLLSHIKVTSVVASNNLLRKALINAGDVKKNFKKIVEETINILPDLSESKAGHFLAVTIGYFKYIESTIMDDEREESISELLELKLKYPIKTRARDLPPFLDVQKFSYYLTDYFKKCSLEDLKLFFPIKLWWSLTTIIPIRSGEFVDIPRKCLVKNGEEYLIKLPRSKQPASNKNIEIIDILPIPEQIYNDINYYKELTDPFGSSKTLLSYKAYSQIVKKTHKRKHVNELYFLLSDLNDLLHLFFKKLEFEYKILFISKLEFRENEHLFSDSDTNPEVLMSNFRMKINSPFIVKPQPNDTRHFAICNMMLQGIDPLIISRAAGHKHLNSQYHYQGHMEFFVESTTYESLIKKSVSNLVNVEENFIVDLLEIRNKSLAPKEIYDYLEEVEVGYCTDRETRCQSRKCIFCEYNYIPYDQLNNNIEEVYSIAKDCSKEVRFNSKLLDIMYKSISYNYKEQRYTEPNELENIRRTAKLLRGGVDDYTTLLLNIGGGDNSRSEKPIR